MQASGRRHYTVRYVDWIGILVLTLAGFMGCDRQSRSPPTREGATGQEVPVLALSSVPTVSIGGDDEREEYLIGRTIGALRLSDGRIVVADGQTRQLRYYDGQGRHLRTVGRSGDGPGEFERLESLVRMRGDTVAAWDRAQRRISIFSPNGDLASTVTNSAWNGFVTELQKRYPRHYVFPLKLRQVYGEQVVIQLAAEPIVKLIRGTQVVQDTMPLLVVHRTGDRWAGLGMFAGTEFFIQEGLGATLPLGETVRVAAGDDVIYAGSTRDTAIQIMSTVAGEVVGSITLPGNRRATSSKDIEAMRRRIVEGMQPNLQTRMARYADAVPWPDSLPIFSDLLVGADPRLWVQRYRAPTDVSQEWLVFQPSGELSATFAMDSSLRLLDAGRDYAIVQATDEMGVEEIRMHRLLAAQVDR